jgi:hypothetical protein
MNINTNSLLILVFCSLFLGSISEGAGKVKLDRPNNVLNDTLIIDSLKQRAIKAMEESAKLRPTATSLQAEFLDYKQKAKSSKGGAIDEANDGFQMSSEAVKDCEEIDKIAKKVASASPKMKAADILKLVTTAEKKVHNIKYLIHLTEERRKEVHFELKGR